MSDGMKYEITWIPIKKLSVIWRKSQRAYDEKWAQKIADDFDPEKFQPVTVTRANGNGIYHIIDGQHSKGAAEIALGPDQKIPCRVIGDADPVRAAQLFEGINSGRKGIKPVAHFLVAVEGWIEPELSISNLIKKAGYHVSNYAKSENNISAVGALKKIYNDSGSDNLFWTLQACRAIWGNDPQGVSGTILTGMAMFVNEFHSHLNLEHLRKTITDQYKSPGNFLEAVRLESEKSSENMSFSMGELLRIKYNKRLPENKKLKRKEA